MILSLSADDSTDKHQPIISAGAVIGFPEDVYGVECLWRKRLDRDGIPYFRAYDCKNLAGVFDPRERGWSLNVASTIANAAYLDLVDMLRSHPEAMQVGLSMRLTEYREAISESKEALNYWGSNHTVAIYKALLSTVAQLLEQDWPESRQFPIACEFDIHTGFAAAEQAYCEFREIDPLVAARFGHIGHADDKVTPALQMADLIAGQSREHTLDFFEGKAPAEIHERRNNIGSMYYLGIMRKEHLLKAPSLVEIQ